MKRSHARALAALALTTTVAALGTVPATATQAGAPTAQSAAAETVLPQAQRRIPRGTRILDAGTTGLLLAQEADDRLLWIDYATGARTALATRLASKPVYNVDSGYFEQAPFSSEPGFYGAGSDTVALYSATPAPHVSLQKGAGAVLADIALPSGQTYKGTFGDTVVTAVGDPNAPTGYHLLKAGGAGGKATDTPVTGLLEGAESSQVVDGDAKSVIVRHTVPVPSGTVSRWSVIDLATGQAKGLPDRPDPADQYEITDFRLAPQGLLRIHGSRSLVDLLDRANPDAAPLRTLDTSVLGWPEYALLGGETLLGVDPMSIGNNDRTGSILWSFHNGNEDRHVELGSARPQLVTAPDGSVLAVGSVAESSISNGDVDWAVHRLTRSVAGATEVKRVATVDPVPASVYGLALGSGILNTSDNSTAYAPATIIGTFRTTRLSTGPGTPSVVSQTVDRSTGGRDADCSQWDSKRCLEMFSAGDGNHGRRKPTEQDGTVLYRSGSTDWGPRVTTGESSPALADLSGRFGIVDGLSSTNQYVTEFKEPDSGATLLKRSRVASAVWGSTLWSGSTTDGTVSRQNLPEGAAQNVFKTLDNCVPNQLQAVGRWVYWACPKDWGKPAVAGLFDQTTGKAVAVPADPALLGDGYLVRGTQANGLELTDLSGGVPVAGTALPTRVLVSKAKLGASTGPRTGWTVDRFGGNVAYVDDTERVHIVPTGVTASQLTPIDSVAPAAALDLKAKPAQQWTGKWWLSKPAASWKLTVRNKTTGVTTLVRSGADARGLIAPTWDGTDASGKLLYSGAYDWTLTAQPADGQGAALTATGAVALSGAGARPRDFVGDGYGDLFGFKADGTAEFLPGGPGAFGAAVSGGGWTGDNAVNAVLPFGDVDNDGCNDVLVRTAAGALRAYRPGCGQPLTPASPYTVIGLGGWNAYDTLIAPGDLTGDGRTDLLARNNTTGQLYMYALKGTGLQSGLTSKALIAEGMQGYLLAGARDLNGDGRGDMVGRDPSGKLWFYPGQSDGKLAPRVEIGTGWQIFNALVGVGDITGDGKSDLVARDTAGALWRYVGRGNGTFEKRVKISDGWGTYASLS
ncbi:FG-GAP repeat domain-containing protein [Streptomyces sp. NPDC060031]|uniref:FG-GAP repeat domain-containing protein n=1 Tax=Streptomyces sp. NPDC060031 TaxID=3347043 RepID=UPI00367AFD68